MIAPVEARAAEGVFTFVLVDKQLDSTRVASDRGVDVRISIGVGRDRL